MNWNELVAVRPAIEALIAEFAYLIDHGRGSEVHELFTEDGIYGRSTGTVAWVAMQYAKPTAGATSYLPAPHAICSPIFASIPVNPDN